MFKKFYIDFVNPYVQPNSNMMNFQCLKKIPQFHHFQCLKKIPQFQNSSSFSKSFKLMLIIIIICYVITIPYSLMYTMEIQIFQVFGNLSILSSYVGL